MAINLVTKFHPYVDEMFKKESKKALVTNQDFETKMPTAMNEAPTSVMAMMLPRMMPPSGSL